MTAAATERRPFPTTTDEIDVALTECWTRLKRARVDGNAEAICVYQEQLNRLLGWRKQLTDKAGHAS